MRFWCKRFAFLFLHSCHKPVSVHRQKRVPCIPDRHDFSNLFALCSLLCLLNHAAGVDVCHSGLYASVSHLPLYHRELPSLFDPSCTVGVPKIVRVKVEGYFLAVPVCFPGQFLQPFLYGPGGDSRVFALYL